MVGLSLYSLTLWALELDIKDSDYARIAYCTRPSTGMHPFQGYVQTLALATPPKKRQSMKPLLEGYCELNGAT